MNVSKMENSNSNSSDDPQLITETLSFDENTFSVLPVIVDGQTISLADLDRDPLETDALLSEPFSPNIITLNDGSRAILPETKDLPDDVVVDECKGVTLDTEDVTEDMDGEVEVEKELEDVEGDTINLPLIVTEEAPAIFEAQVFQLDGGTLAYIHAQPQDGSQAIVMEDGTIAYITLTQPVIQETEELTVAEQPKTDKQQKHRSFMCPQEGCGRLYTSSHHLKVHERTHTGSRPYNCTVEGCTKAFSTDYSRKAHIRTHTGEKPYKCPEKFCTKSFKTSGDLQKHIRTHTGERPFMCPVEGCDRSFTTSNIRKVHIRTHTGERPYVCTQPYCDKAFASATNYKNHIRIHSGEKPYCCNVSIQLEKPYHCNVCGRSYRQVSTLTVHKRTAHSVIEADDGTEIVLGNVLTQKGCNKRFTEYSSLYKHHLVHTQEKPYHCNVCGRSYRQVSTLTVHKRTAHGVIEADDGTEIVLGNVLTQKVLKSAKLLADSRKLKSVSAIPTSVNLLNDGDYILDSGGSIQRISSEQIFIIEDIPEHLKALQHIQDPDDEELQAALDPLQEQ